MTRAPQSGLNCHFISRFLTTPWEYGQRRFWYFDFDSGHVRSCSSKRLFAVTDTNTGIVESRINRVIETPISRAIASLVDMQADSEELLEWTLIRALSLLFMLQPIRSAASSSSAHAERLEETITRSDAELDEFARAAQELYQLGRISVRTVAALLYPASGFFPLVAQQKDGIYGAAIAIPVSGRHVFVAVPRSFDWASSTAVWAANGSGFVANASVGMSSQVVIPPSALKGMQPEEVDARLREMRATLQQLVSLCGARNEALSRLNAASGLL